MAVDTQTSSNPKVSKDVAWFLTGLPLVPDDTRDLLQNWSGIDPRDQGIEKHVEVVVSLKSRMALVQAWAYSTGSATKRGKSSSILAVGGYRFIELGLASHPWYKEVLELLKPSGQSGSSANDSGPDFSKPVYLDIGCCVGQDLRYLAHAGVPSAQLIGVELEPAFLNIGYELFQDQAKLQSTFLTGNIEEFAPASPGAHALAPLVGRISVVWASAFLHLWGHAGQLEVCRKLVALLRDQPGVMVLGRQSGNSKARELQFPSNRGGLMYQHNEQSLKELWAAVLEAEEDPASPGTLRSARGGVWQLAAQFEPDKPYATHQADKKMASDWYSKVTAQGSEVANGASEGAESGAGQGKTRFILWRLKRIA